MKSPDNDNTLLKTCFRKASYMKKGNKSQIDQEIFELLAVPSLPCKKAVC